MTTSLITGANKGLGFETARQLVAAGHRAWIGARDEDRGRRAAEQLRARYVQLDVTDDASVAAAAETVGSLDVLVNNAGIPGDGPHRREIPPPAWRSSEGRTFGRPRTRQAVSDS